MCHRGLLTWGIILTAVGAAITIPVTLSYSDDPMKQLAMAITLQLFIGFMPVIGIIFIIVGVLGEVRARRFNAQDWALADALAESFRELWNQPPGTAYQSGDGELRVQDARLVEIERHFDAQTSGAITGTMTHQLRVFGHSFSATYGRLHGSRSGSAVSFGNFAGSIRGLSEVNLGISTTTRDHLLGDALFAVLEAPGPAGDHDTYRVISMSQPGVAGWINDLVCFTADQVGGPLTHAGTTVLAWANDLITRFVPTDISYVTDRLKAVHSRPAEQREPVTVRGVAAGRNAIIATSVAIGNGDELHLMPARFPGMLGQAVAVGMANAERELPHGSRPSITQS